MGITEPRSLIGDAFPQRGKGNQYCGKEKEMIYRIDSKEINKQGLKE